ncbi:MAG: ATP-binding protein [Ignavibacteriaceae bacterium]
MQKILNLELTNSLTETETIIHLVEQHLADNNCREEILFNINLVVDEVFSNIVRYAFTNNTEHKILFSAYKNGNDLTLEFIDEGKPFNPLKQKAPDITGDIEKRKAGGLGIHLVKKFSKSIIYKRENEKNIFSVTFNLNMENNNADNN